MPPKAEISPEIRCPADITEGIADEFDRQLDRALSASDHAPVVIDCGGLQNVTSSHINLLWRSYLKCKDAGRTLILQAPTDRLRDVLKVLDLFEIFFPGVADERKESAPTGSPPATGKHSFQLKFNAAIGDIHEAVDRFKEFLRNAGIGPKAAFELKTVFYEVSTNIRLHGSLADDDVIRVNAESGNRVFRMEFIDPGRPFDVTRRAETFDVMRAIKTKQTRGFGLAMVSRMTDRMRYERKEGRYNVLTLEKVWDQ